MRPQVFALPLEEDNYVRYASKKCLELPLLPLTFTKKSDGAESQSSRNYSSIGPTRETTIKRPQSSTSALLEPLLHGVGQMGHEIAEVTLEEELNEGLQADEDDEQQEGLGLLAQVEAVGARVVSDACGLGPALLLIVCVDHGRHLQRGPRR